MNQRRNFLKLVSFASAGAVLSSRVAMAGIGTADRCVGSGLRKVVLDVGTTGLDPGKGHRITEIAAIEIVDRGVTDHCFYSYCDPERALDPGAIEVTGLTREFLTGKPKFGEIVNALMLFIGDAPLVIHNAPFDLAFLDADLERLGREPVFRTWPRVVDTLQLARTRKLERVSLQHLCAHYGIPFDQEFGTTGLKAAKTVARVYLAMTIDAE